ncbi:YggS family pyridoxal phosphate-dependent enzyme [Chitinophaga pendula]|uniref:YggS family pyridoxal phosphate-dependent enzyme n=1 Tax=Chitinophaga TaxID=79328 RepID=UPI000BAEF895|nr:MULTISPECIES: YggS family pyridoxal phosphate-dependent enzyme [Chitinophaga]ASZ12897.1 YggS family pyridoxal phosphate-dependent enzyme [Chitinophaga sp. MD30]UCJ09475.1 YggS family pyridoxal phosphate-dependent enzyme [Chitinophaga pendula]
MKERIIANIRHTRQRITHACQEGGRDPQTVRLLLATKTVPAATIRIAIEAGERLTGENKVQELRDKDEALAGLPIERHFIGHLQTNKIKEVLRYVTCIQSLDRLQVAQELDKRLQAEGRSLDVFIQVNTSGETSKFGIDPAEAVAFLKMVSAYDTLRIRGLMTIGLLDAEKEKMRPSLTLLRTTRDHLLQEGLAGIHTLQLSMGMSQDLEMAIAEGADIVRVGTAVFGNRIPGKEVWNEEGVE